MDPLDHRSARPAILFGAAALALATACAETLIGTSTRLACDEPVRRSLRVAGGERFLRLGDVRAGFRLSQVRGEAATVSWDASADSLQPHVTRVRLLDGRDSTALFELPVVPADSLERRFPGSQANLSHGRETYRGTVPVDDLFDAVEEHGVWFEVRTSHPDHPVLGFWARPYELEGWGRRCVYT